MCVIQAIKSGRFCSFSSLNNIRESTMPSQLLYHPILSNINHHPPWLNVTPRINPDNWLRFHQTGRRKIGGTVNSEHYPSLYPLESNSHPLINLIIIIHQVPPSPSNSHPTPIPPSHPQVHCCDVYHGCEEVQAEVAYVLAEPLRWLRLVDEHRATRTWAPNFAPLGWNWWAEASVVGTVGNPMVDQP